MKARFEDPELTAVDLDRLGKDGPKRKGASARPVMDTGPPSDHVNDEFAFWRYRDLVARRIVSDRTDLLRKQQRGFPKAVKLSKGLGAVALFRVSAVKQWVLENLGSADPDDRLCDRRHKIEHSAEQTG